MIVAAVVVPQPPALLPGLTGGPVPELEQLRRAAADAVRWIVGAAATTVVVGPAQASATWPDLEPMRSGFLGEPENGPRLPLSLSVVHALLPAGASVEWCSVAVDATPHEAAALGRALADRPEPTGLVVAGDGSARRGPKAPGFEDVRAGPFDDSVAAALAAADTAALADLDAVLAAELLASGRAAWQVLAAACAGASWAAEVSYADDPLGVCYLVARWSRR